VGDAWGICGGCLGDLWGVRGTVGDAWGFVGDAWDDGECVGDLWGMRGTVGDAWGVSGGCVGRWGMRRGFVGDAWDGGGCVGGLWGMHGGCVGDQEQPPEGVLDCWTLKGWPELPQPGKLCWGRGPPQSACVNAVQVGSLRLLCAIAAGRALWCSPHGAYHDASQIESTCQQPCAKQAAAAKRESAARPGGGRHASALPCLPYPIPSSAAAASWQPACSLCARQAERARAVAAAAAAAAAHEDAGVAGARAAALEAEMRALLGALQRQRAAGAARMAQLAAAVRELQAPYLAAGP